MAKTGRPPTPLKLLKLRGSKWAKDREEPGMDLTGADVPIEPPAWLSDEARLVWDQVLGWIQPMGLTGRMDTHLLGRYCTVFVQWLAAKTFIEQYGAVRSTKDAKGQIKMVTYPQMRLFKQLADMLLQMEIELGMSPSARASFGIDLRHARQGEGPKPVDDKSRFFSS